jgi:hypothetical protein
MKRKPCPDCGFAVSAKSTYCPKCGRRAPRFGIGAKIAMVSGGVLFLVLLAVVLMAVLKRAASG